MIEPETLPAKIDLPEWMKRDLPDDPSEDDILRVNRAAALLGVAGAAELELYGENKGS